LQLPGRSIDQIPFLRPPTTVGFCDRHNDHSIQYGAVLSIVRPSLLQNNVFISTLPAKRRRQAIGLLIKPERSVKRKRKEILPLYPVISCSHAKYRSILLQLGLGDVKQFRVDPGIARGVSGEL
jgi:hypothetical protein